MIQGLCLSGKAHANMVTKSFTDFVFTFFSSEAPDVLSVTPINVNIPNVTLPNNTMQYVLIGMKEKLMTLPDRIDEPRF